MTSVYATVPMPQSPFGESVISENNVSVNRLAERPLLSPPPPPTPPPLGTRRDILNLINFFEESRRYEEEQRRRLEEARRALRRAEDEKRRAEEVERRKLEEQRRREEDECHRQEGYSRFQGLIKALSVAMASRSKNSSPASDANSSGIFPQPPQKAPAQASSPSEKNKGDGNAALSKQLQAQGTPCPSCTQRHGPGKCRAANQNCARTGHYPRTARCPASKTQCHLCHLIGHFDNCCMKNKKKSGQGGSSSNRNTSAKGHGNKQTNCRRLGAFSAIEGTQEAKVSTFRRFNSPSGTTVKTPKPTSVRVSFGDIKSRLQMLPDTGADFTVIGLQHLQSLGIPRSSLQAPPPLVCFTADGSQMSPALGTFQATLTLGKKSCLATIHVHENVQLPLLSYGHCQELAIISADFPKPIVEVRHANRCSKLPLSATTSPSAAKDYFLQEFKDVLVSKEESKAAPLKPMTGPPMKVHLKDGAVPFATHTPRQIPFAFKDQVKEELDSMVVQGIIKEAGDDPSVWRHPLVVVTKNGSGVRITVDLSKLNSPVSHPTHPSPTPFAAIRSVDPKAKCFTTADALCGYWQMELAEEDQHLTTFITPYGRFMHCRGPMGFAATGDAFCPRGDMALQGVKNCVKVNDDILLHDEDYFTHLQGIHEVLTRCRKFGLTLNKDKFVVAAASVNFCGFSLSKDGISADTGKVSAIKDFPTPANLTDLRSFMGLVNQLVDFTPDIAIAAQPLRPLMSPKRTFVWTPDHDEAFQRVKLALTSPPVLAFFDPNLPVVLQTDASRLFGIGYALLQDHGGGRLRLVQCGSRFLADAETCYATIELEMLAVLWAMSKCRL